MQSGNSGVNRDDNNSQRNGVRKFHQRGENGDYSRHRQPSTIYDVICSNLKDFSKLSDSPKKESDSVPSSAPDVVNKDIGNNNNENIMEHVHENGSDSNGKRPNCQNNGYRSGRFNGQNRGRRHQFNNGYNAQGMVMANQLQPQMPMMQFSPMYVPSQPIMMNYPPPGIEIGRSVLAPSYGGNFYNGTIIHIDPYECTVIVEVSTTHEHINAFWDTVQLLGVAG